MKNTNFFLKTAVFIILATMLVSCSILTQKPTGRFAKSGNLDISYKISGKGDLPVILIHGWSCDSSFWRFQTAYLEKRFMVITIDLPGHGLSSKPRTAYTQELFADSIKAVMDDAGIKKAILAGHSMGFPVSRIFLQKYPERISGICIVDGHYQRVPSGSAKLAEWKKQNEKIIGLLKSDNRIKNIREFIESFFVEKTTPELRKEIIEKMLKTPDYVANSAMEESMNPDVWREFRSEIPALAIYAANPEMASDNRIYLKTLFPNIEYHEWNDAGHFLMMEHPERFNLIFENFIKKTAESTVKK